MSRTVNKTLRISAGRRIAYEVLESVAAGAYASDSLRQRAASLSVRDAGLAGQIVFGSVRFQAQLDHLIGFYGGRKANTLDLPVLIALRAGIFQLRYLARVPPHAAVHESVEWVKRKQRAAANLTNAVLRKVNRKPVAWPDLATELSCPQWLLDRWSAHFGEEQARKIAHASLEEPQHYLRLQLGAEFDNSENIEPTDVPGAFRIQGDVPAGARLHDISSQAILPLLGLEPGDSYLDLCAAPGNKTLQALETPLRLVVACDISFRRLQDVPDVCPRVVLDASEPLPFNTQFRKVFVDAPCSGTGTLARNPEIKWRLAPEELARFADRQKAILRQAMNAVASGGAVLYATCSLEKEENEDVVAEILRQYSEFKLEHQLWRLPGRDPGDGFFAALLLSAGRSSRTGAQSKGT